jgi:type I restriction enzyme S subunit
LSEQEAGALGWETRRVGALVDFHNNLRVPLSKAVRSGRQGPFPYYGAQGIVDWIDDYRFDGRYLLVAEDGENLRSRKQPIARLVDGRFWVNNHAHVLSPRPGIADGRFLMHALNQVPIAGHVTGAAQPKLSKANLAALTIRCPSYADQLCISAVLGALDELIEFNERRIDLLEITVQALFRRFFGGISSSPASGNTVASDLIDVNPKITKRTGPFPRVTMADVSTTHSHVLPSSVTSSFNGSKFQRGDVLMARITPSLENGKTALALFLEPEQIGVGSTEFIVLRGKQVGPAFVYCAARNSSFRDHAIRSMSGASGRQRVANNCFDTLRMQKPAGSVEAEFESMAMPMLKLALQLRKMSDDMASARDLLLPRLVTGRLDISDVDLGTLTPAEPK